MFTGVMKKSFLTLLVLSFLIFPALAENISDIRTRQIEDGIYNLLYLRQQIEAVDNDMFLYLGWKPEEKLEMKEAAGYQINELEGLKAWLSAQGIPIELAEVKNELLSLLNKQQEMYRGIESKTDEQIRSSRADLQNTFNAHTENLGKVLNEHLVLEQLPDDFSVLNEELNLFADSNDRESFKQAVDLLDNKKFKASYEMLVRMRDKYENTQAEPSILLRMSDCILHFDTDLPEEVTASEDGFNFLNDILDKKVYSPILSEAFHRWRTKNQELNYGMSNYSEIPNLEYNDIRMEIVKVIQQHLLTHPKDAYAKYQILALLDLENILRGEPGGNSNLRHMAAFYMDLEKVRSEENAEEAK